MTMGLIWRLIVSTQMRTSVNAVAGSEYAMIPYNGMRRERCSDYFVHHLHVADEENEVSSSDDESEEEGVQPAAATPMLFNAAQHELLEWCRAHVAPLPCNSFGAEWADGCVSALYRHRI